MKYLSVGMGEGGGSGFLVALGHASLYRLELKILKNTIEGFKIQ